LSLEQFTQLYICIAAFYGFILSLLFVVVPGVEDQKKNGIKWL